MNRRGLRRAEALSLSRVCPPAYPAPPLVPLAGTRGGVTVVAASPVDTQHVAAHTVAVAAVAARAGNRPVRPPDKVQVSVAVVDTPARKADTAVGMVADRVDTVVDTAVVAADFSSSMQPQIDLRQLPLPS